MTTTTESAPGKKAERPKKAASPTRSKARPPVIAAGIVLVVVFALLFVWILNAQTHTRQVFTAAGDLPRGHVITTSDLATVDIPEGQPIKSVATTDQGALVGKTVVKDVVGGAIIAPEQVSGGSGLSDSQSIVGLNLTASQIPSYPLAAGDRVRLIGTPGNGQDVPAKDPDAISATVVSTSPSADRNTTLVAVQVPRTQAALLAARAATGRVALILDGGN
ncbi:SAF domain-containing protein [Sinomonas sp. JGH33]|uniref:SAF domain-containing protein n=1 Tax=Sinomonas terricola TaxID=3110330 RepID=A0ABU5TC74_9MICC|nr:SAF domain-containing protein [Sinomonas sp. JGH33]MEA5457293.1 SAF domain-containing protein [Sinomonas sp. JGH33]